MTDRIKVAARLTVAVWRWAWYDPPRYCLRHWVDVALRRYGYRDYGDPVCPRCNPRLTQQQGEVNQ